MRLNIPCVRRTQRTRRWNPLSRYYFQLNLSYLFSPINKYDRFKTHPGVHLSIPVLHWLLFARRSSGDYCTVACTNNSFGWDEVTAPLASPQCNQSTFNSLNVLIEIRIHLDMYICMYNSTKFYLIKRIIQIFPTN